MCDRRGNGGLGGKGKREGGKGRRRLRSRTHVPLASLTRPVLPSFLSGGARGRRRRGREAIWLPQSGLSGSSYLVRPACTAKTETVVQCTRGALGAVPRTVTLAGLLGYTTLEYPMSTPWSLQPLHRHRHHTCLCPLQHLSGVGEGHAQASLQGWFPNLAMQSPPIHKTGVREEIPPP